MGGSAAACQARQYDRGIPGPEFSVAVHAEGSAQVVVVRGDVDLATADLLRGELRSAAAEAKTVVLDLREVSFMDTQGLAVVIEAQPENTAMPDEFEMSESRGALAGAVDSLSLSPRDDDDADDLEDEDLDDEDLDDEDDDLDLDDEDDLDDDDEDDDDEDDDDEEDDDLDGSDDDEDDRPGRPFDET